MIDLHSHVLPGLDDGARTLAESLELARAAARDGITAIAATPHVRNADYPTSAAAMEAALAQVRTALADARIALDVLPGGELSLDRLDDLDEDERRRFGLAGNPRYLLVEFPYHGWPLDLGARLFALQVAGVTPVLAHPERNADARARPERVVELVERGALVQVTASSLDGRAGRGARDAALALLARGAVHLLASDAHTAEVRAVGMSDAAATLRDDELAHWLTTAVPAAIVADEPLPPRPASRRRRRFGLF